MKTGIPLPKICVYVKMPSYIACRDMMFIDFRKKIEKIRLCLWWFYSSKTDDEEIHRVSEEAAAIMGIKPFKNIKICPRFYMANAAVIGFRCRTLVLTKTLLELLNIEELKAVLLHEYAHCKLKHQLKLMSLSMMLLLGIALICIYIVLSLEQEALALGISIPLLIISYILIYILTRFILKRFELEADCLAVSKLNNTITYINILRKIKMVNGDVSGWRAILSPHPPIDKRILYISTCVNK